MLPVVKGYENLYPPAAHTVILRCCPAGQGELETWLNILAVLTGLEPLYGPNFFTYKMGKGRELSTGPSCPGSACLSHSGQP